MVSFRMFSSSYKGICPISSMHIPGFSRLLGLAFLRLAVDSAALTVAGPCGCSSAVPGHSHVELPLLRPIGFLGCSDRCCRPRRSSPVHAFRPFIGQLYSKLLLYCLLVLYKTTTTATTNPHQLSLACGFSAAMLTNVASSEMHKNK